MLLGSTGMLGREIHKQITESYAAANVPLALLCPLRDNLDITNELSVRRFMRQAKPEVIINCTAFREVDGCEKDPVNAELVNHIAVDYLSKAAKSIGARFIHFSTDYVFDGSKEDTYIETDPVNPLQVYGRTKLMGESATLRNGGTVFRIQWLYGTGKPNFVDWVYTAVMDGRKLPIASSQHGSPSSCEFVARITLLSIIKNIPPGLYHLAHDDWTDRMTCASVISNCFNKSGSDCFDEMIDTNFGVAKRPGNTVLNASKLKQALNVSSLGGWREDLILYLKRGYGRY